MAWNGVRRFLWFSRVWEKEFVALYRPKSLKPGTFDPNFRCRVPTLEIPWLLRKP